MLFVGEFIFNELSFFYAAMPLPVDWSIIIVPPVTELITAASFALIVVRVPSTFAASFAAPVSTSDAPETEFETVSASRPLIVAEPSTSP